MSTLLCLFLLLSLSPADAARVADLYAAEVPATQAAGQSQDAIFREALQKVLIRMTGRRDVVTDQAVMERFKNAGVFVQQYRTNPDGSVWVVFDQVALRRNLDELGQPIWGEERPVTLVWLVMDAGMGKRNVLAAEPVLDQVNPDPFVSQEREPSALDLEREALVRSQLEEGARERGVPLLLPLVDSAELETLSLRDIWGGFNETAEMASLQYGADAILIGRARVRNPERIEVRWTLLIGEERLEWQGDLLSGPDGIADIYAARLATSLSGSGRTRMTVAGVASLDDYGRLLAYLDQLDVIESYAVEEVVADTVEFSVLVRGDDERLARSIALNRILQPTQTLQTDPLDTFAAGLHYQLITSP